ncbi:MAG: hypothetical protein CMA28_00115 [Euryarchaeota archaeon]|nr:hypothetical protein [Euryarchaeota archaeon]
MNNITCPHCEQIFEIDAAGYADIAKQVRSAEFESDLHDRLEEAAERHRMEIELAKKEASEKNAKESVENERKITELQGQLKAHATEIELAKREILDQKAKESEDKDKQIGRLKNELEAASLKAELAVREAISPLEKEVMELQGKVDSAETERELLEKSLAERHQAEMMSKDAIIRAKDEEIELRKDFKLKLSTKMVGETLEQHCENQFNSLRATAFPNAYFEKDNDVVDGSKGDYVFRESDSGGVEFVSIMFEMKNEADSTKTKKKNEDFLKELDKDRRAKGCEYAVLVSLLEADNELYNNGIVDMSHKYPKMYVVRPQFFIPIITVLRNASRNTLTVRKELEVVRSQNMDIENFESELLDFQERFSRNYDLASRQFTETIKRIDNSIEQLNKAKQQLLKSGNNYRLANDKAQDLSIKKLTRNNPTMREKFEALEEED